MNAMFNPVIVQTQARCKKHNVPMIEMFNRESCPICAIEFVNASNKQHGIQVQKSVREKHFAGAMIPKRHENSGFRNYNAQLSGQKVALTQTASYAKKIVNGDVTNLVMVGNTGTGKTHLSCATARTLLAKGKYARYITSENLAQDIMGAWSRADDKYPLKSKHVFFSELV